jgi:hypothetical protein
MEKSPAANVERALELMEQALGILDNGDVPADVGAHLDLSMVRLREHLGNPYPAPSRLEL